MLWTLVSLLCRLCLDQSRRTSWQEDPNYYSPATLGLNPSLYFMVPLPTVLSALVLCLIPTFAAVDDWPVTQSPRWCVAFQFSPIAPAPASTQISQEGRKDEIGKCFSFPEGGSCITQQGRGPSLCCCSGLVSDAPFRPEHPMLCSKPKSWLQGTN